MSLDIEGILAKLTLEEKAGLCSGADFWRTKSVPRLGVPSWTMSDGPHGLRKQKEGGGILDATPATCFPSGAGIAATWNPELVQEVGRAIGLEARAHQVDVVLGPAINIKRSPLCGRNFEYYSEDPYLAGSLASRYIQGLQSTGVGTSLKHFAANNQEKDRMTVDVVVDERSLREIYLPAFEVSVKEAQPWTVMCSYNRLNGTYASENSHLLTRILKEEWGHQGIVVTDWGAANDRALGIAAGNELEMPGCAGITDGDIVRAVNEGRLSLQSLDLAVRRLLVIADRAEKSRTPGATFDREAHHALSRRVATESMVLLKNDLGVLPLRGGKIAFIGAFARSPRYQGGGSSHIAPTFLEDAYLEAIKAAPPGTSLRYAQGYRLESDESDPLLLDEARELARVCDIAVVFVGLTDSMESEGYDRETLELPTSHVDLVDAVAEVQDKTVVVLSNGSPIAMPWLKKVPALLEGYLGGQAWGGAVSDILFGRANPSGKLAESFPARIEDTPCFLNFPGDGTRVEYREGVFVGYRYYDAAKIEPSFPFGHGLSYAKFDYGPLRAARDVFSEEETVELSLEISNVGALPGSEVAQLYVSDLKSSVLRPPRELKAFRKIELQPGESKTVTWQLDRRAFAFWSVEEGRWLVESGEFELCAGSSSRDIRTRTIVTVNATRPKVRHYDQTTSLGSLLDHPEAGRYASTLLDKLLLVFGSYESGSAAALMMRNFVLGLPLRNVVRMSQGRLLSAEDCERLCASLNRSDGRVELLAEIDALLVRLNA